MFKFTCRKVDFYRSILKISTEYKGYEEYKYRRVCIWTYNIYIPK